MKRGNLLIVLSLSFLLLFFHLHGFNYTFADEFYVLNPALRLLNGEVPYKDFLVTYNPGAFFVLAYAFKIFGSSVLTGRMVAWFISLLTLGLIFRISYRYTKQSYFSWMNVLSYAVWAPMQINYASPGIFANFLGILSLYFLTKKNLTRTHLFWIGIVIFLIFIFKQNFGFAALGSVIFFLILCKDKWFYKVCIFLYGYVFMALVVLLYFIKHDAVWAFIENFKYYSVQIIFLENISGFTMPDIGNNIILFSGKVLFYLSPLVIPIITTKHLISNKSLQLATPILCIFYYFLGIWPVTDYIHVVPLLGLSTMTIIYILNFKVRCLFFVIIITLGFYQALFGNFFRWGEPIYKHKFFSSNEHLLIWTDKATQVNGARLLAVLLRETQGEKFFFVNQYAPQLYFLTGKKNPTRFDYITKDSLSEKYQFEIINDLQSNNVRFVLNPVNWDKGNSILNAYIDTNYSFGMRIENFDLLAKNQTQ